MSRELRKCTKSKQYTGTLRRHNLLQYLTKTEDGLLNTEAEGTLSKPLSDAFEAEMPPPATSPDHEASGREPQKHEDPARSPVVPERSHNDPFVIQGKIKKMKKLIDSQKKCL